MKSELKSLMFLIVLTILLFFGGGKAHSSNIQVTIPDTSGENSDTVAIPIFVSEVPDDTVRSFQMTLTFKSSVLTADSAYTEGTMAEGWGAPTYNVNIPGQIGIAMAGVYPLIGSGGNGILIYVVFIVNGSDGDSTIVHFDNMMFNEGEPEAETKDGLFKVGHGTGVKDENESPGRPTEMTLFQNYPNPFNPETEIEYVLPKDAEVRLIVYNLLGQKIKTLIEGFESAGLKTVSWDGTNDWGIPVGSGVYFYRITAGESTQLKKMLLLR